MHVNTLFSFSLPVVICVRDELSGELNGDSHFPAERNHHSHPSMVASGGVRRFGARFDFFPMFYFYLLSGWFSGIFFR